MKKLVVSLGLFSLVAIGCGTGSELAFGQHRHPIINGELPDAAMHEAVVSLHQRSGGYVSPDIFCSGTLIAPDVVLTAAHCLDVGNRKPRTLDASSVAVYLGDNPATDDAPRFAAVTEALIHPSYDSVRIVNDLGLLRLAAPVTDVTPVPALPATLGFTAADEGRLVLNFAGFGRTETGSYNEKLQFDGLLTRIESPTQIYYTQRAGGPCSGDSGGPAFVVRGGVPYVGGLTSYGDYYCTQYGVSTRVDAFEAFIADFVGTTAPPPPAADCSADGVCNPECAADEDPDCAAPPPPSGDAVCGDGLCALSESADLCYDDCVISHPKKGVIATCGDGLCDKRENAEQCPADCGP